jgi:murein DD-endopeptidase MepM/ murein hydrolase activator NlpD
MTPTSPNVRRDWRRDVRTFAAGAACGLLAGILLVLIPLWQYNYIGLRALRPSNGPDDSGPAVLEPAPETPSSTLGSRPTPMPALRDRAVVGVFSESPPELRDRDLLIPVDGVTPEQLNRDFSDLRGGSRLHEALDIPAARNTPVRAVEDGTIARLFYSKAGGVTIYQFDPTYMFCYYYAHLERYADGLTEGARVRKGQIVGYVGTSGNAPKNTPHLHFAIFRLTDAKHWWEGTAIDPFDVLR